MTKSLLAFLCAGAAVAMHSAPVLAQQDPTISCLSSIPAVKELEPIKSKLYHESGRATFEMLANTDKATDAEKPLLAKLASIRQRCYEQGIDFRRRYPPAVNQIVMRSATDSMEAILKLYEGNLTYGQYLRLRQQQGDALNRDLAELDNAAQAQQRMAATQQEADDEARRRVILQHLLQRNF